MGFGASFSQGLNSGISSGINMKMMKKLSAGHTQTPITRTPDALDDQSSYSPSVDSSPDMPEM